MAPLGRPLGASTPTGGTLGGGSLGRSLLGGSSLGSSLGKSSLNGSSTTGAKPGLGSTGGRFPTVAQQKDPFQQAPLGGIKDPPEVSKTWIIFGCLFCFVEVYSQAPALEDNYVHFSFFYSCFLFVKVKLPKSIQI